MTAQRAWRITVNDEPPVYAQTFRIPRWAKPTDRIRTEAVVPPPGAVVLPEWPEPPAESLTPSV